MVNLVGAGPVPRLAETPGRLLLLLDAVARVAAPLGFDEMVEHLEALGLMRQKIPEQLEHLDEMPRNPSGKIPKAPLVARFA